MFSYGLRSPSIGGTHAQLKAIRVVGLLFLLIIDTIFDQVDEKLFQSLEDTAPFCIVIKSQSPDSSVSLNGLSFLEKSEPLEEL